MVRCSSTLVVKALCLNSACWLVPYLFIAEYRALLETHLECMYGMLLVVISDIEPQGYGFVRL